MSVDPLEVFDVGSSSDDAAATSIGPQPAAAERRPAAALPAWAALALTVIALVGLTAAVLQWRHQARTVTVVHTVGAGSAVSIDASGCPVATECEVTAGARQLAETVLNWDPQATIVAGSQSRTPAGVAVRSTLIAETSVTFPNGSPLERARTALTIVAQCVPGGAALSSSQRTDATRRVQTLTVAGRIGCSVTVTAAAEDGVAVPIDSLDDLAHRRGLQL